MKKSIVVIALSILSLQGFSQRQWGVGIYSGILGNNSTYSGGMSDASALFNHNRHGCLDFGGVARYYVTNHWSFQTGLNHSRFGFDFALAQDYSLLKPKSHYVGLNSSFGVTQVPLTAIYAFNPNCRNVRFFVGAGVNVMAHAGNVTKHSELVSTETSPLPAGESLSQDLQVNSFVTMSGQFVWGVEHIEKCGSILQLAFLANRGFTDLATSTVNYTVAGQSYQHIFTNHGNYFGVMLSYYFKPFPKKAAK